MNGLKLVMFFSVTILGLAVAREGLAESDERTAQSQTAPTTEDVTDSQGEGDALSDSVYIAPTALFGPKGTFTIQSQELFFLGVGYSITDDISLSFHTLVPVRPFDIQPFVAAGKLKLFDGLRLHIAAQGTLLGVLASDDLDAYEDTLAAIVGVAGTYCLNPDCASYLNGYGGAGFLVGRESQESVPLGFSVGWVHEWIRGVKTAVELDSAAVAGAYNELADGVLLFYGARFASRSIGASLGFIAPLGIVESDGPWSDTTFPVGVPWVSFTYRHLGD